MDRPIEKKFWTAKRIVGITLVCLIIFAIFYMLLFRDSSSRLNVSAERLTISEVERGAFQEWIPINGIVVPVKSVYIDAIEGGRAEEVFAEEGSMVESNQPILKLSNTNLLLDIMYREAELYRQINDLRNTRLAMEKHRLELRSALLDLDYQLSKGERDLKRVKVLQKTKMISDEEFKEAQDEYDYLFDRRELTLETHHQDSLFRQVQIAALEASVERMQSNLEIVRGKLDNLLIRAPIAGQLTSLDAEVGQLKAPGMRIGQIDVLESFILRCGIDEHYIARITKGLIGEFNFANNAYRLQVIKIYPEVQEGRFEVDMGFMDNEPEGIRRGQTFRIHLELSAPVEVVMLPRGGFYQSTGGRWIFVLDETGEYALRRPIRLGRQNTQMYEVLDGLEPGERVLTSSYENFGDADKLVLKK
ncbi:MAG: HlyD family efflux transporter periplasmic adaptor subunit [Candidatus Hatepunaea meridiana]|nr:HlyD family efflux transporter periplasmic adaptor subunit [Candidatus Hatepunaea meridiana]